MHLGRATAWQDRQNTVSRLQSECTARRRLIRLQRNHTGQRMTHVGRCNAMCVQQRCFEWKDAQHVVGALVNFVDTVCPPSPDGRAHKVNCFDTGTTQSGFKCEVEVGCIDTNEQVRLVRQQLRGELVSDACDFTVMAQHLNVATHGQFVAGPLGRKPLLHHARATNPMGMQLGPTLSQSFQK